ncbi:hypothetical protein NB573_06320 [Vibrio alginolyticus]|uniref:hypothetical protein n=1 Tax=Vibrio alginolyticus TaxID=663 RepID=UPI00215C2F6A|nr:hypothetical protein [Vibrio alginolyticus]MCR9959661.1 hypothetical protein [Vibrio alginolyticus]
MTQNIEQRTLAATSTMEGAAKAVNEIANTDKVVVTAVGERKSFPQISREWDEKATELKTIWENDSTTLRQDWQSERNELSTKALGVKPWETGVSETNINQQRRWDDGHTYLPKTVPAVMDANGPNDDWIPYTADKSGTLSDVFGRKPIDLVDGIVLAPDASKQYPKLNAVGKVWELEDGEQQLSVKSFAESADGYLVITLNDGSQIIAKKVDGASRNWVNEQSVKQTRMLMEQKLVAGKQSELIGIDIGSKTALQVNDYPKGEDSLFVLSPIPEQGRTIKSFDFFSGVIVLDNDTTIDLIRERGEFDSLDYVKQLTLRTGDRFTTKARYSGWAVNTMQGCVGGGTYIVKTLTRHRSDINNPEYFPDNKIDHDLGDGRIMALIHNGTIYVEQAGARVNTDDDSFSDALQAIVNYSGNPAKTINPHSLVTKATANTFIARHPCFVNSQDGLKWDFPGSFNFTIKISAQFHIEVPADFPDDGNDYNVVAVFIFARRRVTGRTNQFILPDSSGAGAAWFYRMHGIYFDATAYMQGLGSKRADLIYAPEIANTKVSNVVGHKCRHLLNTVDELGAYQCLFEDVHAFYCLEPYKVKRGTTLNHNNCSIVHCDFGWTQRTNYSTYNSCSVDHSAFGNYSWDIGGTGVVMNGCGSEYAYGGLFRATQRSTEITINGGFFLGGASATNPNYAGQASDEDFGVSRLVLIDGAKVTINRAMFRAICQPDPAQPVVHLRPLVSGGGKVTIIGDTGEDHNSYVQRKDWEVGGHLSDPLKDRSRIDFVGEQAEFKVINNQDFSIPSTSDTIDIVFDAANREVDQGPAWFDEHTGLNPRNGDVANKYVAPYAGYYTFHFLARIENVTENDYIYIDAEGRANHILVISDSDNKAEVNLTETFWLNAGDEVRVRYRRYGSGTVVKSGYRFFGYAR